MSQHNPVSPVQEGQILAGKYRVSHVIAVGGMGVVVAATHVQLDQIVALKFVHPTAAQNPAAVERFLREARSAVRLRSEHVAKVLDVGTLDSGMPFIVMEFLEGADLGRVLQTGGPLSIESATDFVLQACEAVAEAHSIGLVHRDLKPQNLFLTKRVGGAPLVKVLDFGISKMTVPLGSQPSLTQTATFTGSPFYMAPEQMRSTRVVDPRTDIWALGVVLFELLTTRVPFEAETVPELCLKIAQDPPRSLEELRPDVPLGLAQLVSRCLQKDPAMRFADAAELASALEPFATAASRHIAERTRRIVSGFRSTAPSIPHRSLGLGRDCPRGRTEAGRLRRGTRPTIRPGK